LIELIGHGAAADVYLAKTLDPDDETQYAIKIYYRQKLQRHVEDIYNHLDHDTCIKIKESGKDCHIKLHQSFNELRENVMRYNFLVMDYVKGTSLFEYCKKHGPLGEHIGHQFFIKIMKFMHYIVKENISHRDLKLENVLLDSNKNIKVIDFDFAEKNTQRNSL
jgi:serine/threonine protein kinase